MLQGFFCLCVIRRVAKNVDVRVLCMVQVTEGLHMVYVFPYPETFGC